MTIPNIKPLALAIMVTAAASPVHAQADDTALMKRQIASLEARIEAMEDRLRVLEASPSQQLSRSFTEQKQELDEAIDLGEFAIRRFFDMMRDVEEEAQKRERAE
ncbi:MAG: hypothetical protein AAF141_07150 [Pseudomonadota bacterium]